MPARKRVDHNGVGEREYRRNRKAVLAKADVCAICGMPIDRSLKFPHPLSGTADHIIPVSKGGSPTDPANLQAAHLICNQIKGSKLTIERNKNIEKETSVMGNDVLPLSVDWMKY